MRLELADFRVTDVLLSETTSYSGGVLYVSEKDIQGLVAEDSHIVDVEVAVARPGDRTRIINVLDVVEPRHKVSGPGAVFPGVIGPPVTVGQGRDHRLSGMSLITTGEPAPGESVHWRDGIIDMWGPGARYTPFSSNINLVLKLKGKEHFTPDEEPELERLDVINGSLYSQEYNLSARAAGFRVADCLASATRGMEPDGVENFELAPVAAHLPRVAYTCHLHLQRLYGERMGWQPTWLHPNEMMDGAVFSTFMDLANHRDASYIYQNNPVIKELYGRHGTDINFLGVLLYIHGGETIVEKERIADYGVKLLKMRSTDGVIMSWSGSGHPGIDFMMWCQKCERAGIKTTLLNPEMARTSSDPGFLHYVPEAQAIVSTGNYEMSITLPHAERVLGGDKLSVPRVDASGPLPLSLRYIYSSTIPMGHSRLGGVGY